MSCFGDTTGPGHIRRAPLAIAPVFDQRALSLVAFDRVRLHLVRLGTGEPVEDTVVSFPSTADSVAVGVAVPVTGTTDTLSLTLAMITAAGDTVFRGGPTTVIVELGTPTRAVTDIPTVYVGVGSNAAAVRFKTPVPTAVFFADTAVMTAEALDSAGQVIAGTPILYLIDPRDTALASVPSVGVGRVVGKTVRGPARVIAELLTHQTATTTLTIQPRPAVVAVSSGNAQTALVGTALAQPVVVRVKAADSLGVQGVVVNFAVASGGGTLASSTATTDTLGYASVGWTLGQVSGTQTVTATVTGLAPATATATATAGSATHLAFTVQPSNATAGAAITPAVQVAAQDGFGNVVAAFTGAVTVALGTNPGRATLGGTLTVNAAAGVASFGNLALTPAASGYTLVASASGLTGATSAAFNVAAGAADTLALVSGNNQNGLLGQPLPQPIVVRVMDAYRNGVRGFSVAFATATGGSVGAATVATDSTGAASTTWTLGTTGSQTLTVTASGLKGSPLTITANTASMVVSPKLDTLTSLGDTVRLAAQKKDGLGNVIPDTVTWVSRGSAFATVNALGTVTAVSNGQTYLVATDAAGLSDSALIVVDQRIASVSVTPAARSIYLTRNFTFTAAAVDGRGNPIASVTSFTWSSTAPAVASVDTSTTATNLVTAVGLGTAQVKATSGAITGVSNVTVLTPITRIAVAVDSSGATKTDTATLPSLGVTRRYHAYAYDTLNVLMPSVTQFTWASTNPSVAAVPSQTSDTATATSAANGVTTINATAQGFTSKPGASLTVSQVLASIQLSPATATIGVGGSFGLTARGLDANGHYIAGGSFTYRSTNPLIAMVDTAGRVAGVALGTDTVTAASGTIVSNPSVITVSQTVPPAIFFGRDTLSVGRGSSTSVPILLSTPVATGASLIVKLSPPTAAGAPAYAHWSTPAVTIPSGATSTNATLIGDSAGTATAIASDSSGLGYAPDTAVVKVTANMRLTSSSYAINATDVVKTQVLLSDPSPAGGTYISFAYGTAGVAAVSPDPAFIPAGQLAADIQITGLAAGTTTITPTAIGVNGAAASFTAYAPVLTLSSGYPTGTSVLGLGQYQSGIYVYLPTSTNVAVPVTLTSSDTLVTTVTPTVTIPVGSSYAYFTFNAIGLGAATITPSATGWTSRSTLAVVASTPHVGLCCNSTIYTTSGIQNLTVYSEDSTGTVHYRINSLVVNVRSSDPTVMQVIDSVVTINPGAYYTSGVRVTPGSLGGTAYLIASASGHTPDSVLYTVNGPPLRFNWSSGRVGAGEQDQNLYVYTPNNVLAPLVVKLSNTDTTKVTVPDSVIITTGTNLVSFNVLGRAPGSVTIGATATGFQSTSATYTVTSPAISACCGYPFNKFNVGSNVTVYSVDSVGTTHYRTTPLVVSLYSTDTTKVKVDSASVTIAAGAYLNNSAHVTPVDTGVALIIFSAPGMLAPDTLTMTVTTPPIRFSFGTILLGRRQHVDPNGNGFYVYTPDNRSVAVPVTLAQKYPAVDTLRTASPTIAAGTNYVYDDVYGLTNGTDTLTVSATDYAPSTAYIVVSTPRLTSSNLPSTTTTTNPPIGINIYATDSVGNAHYTMDTVVVHAVSSDTTVLRPDSAYYHIPKNVYYISRTVIVTGPGSAHMVYSDSANSGYLPDTTNTMTVTGPSLALSSTSSTLGMRQTSGATGYYVYTPNNVVSPLVVHLLSTDTSVATVVDSVIIASGNNLAYFGVTGRDTIGTIQIQATATGYAAKSMTVQVTYPKFAIGTSTSLNTTSPRTNITVYAEDQSGTMHYTTENVVVTLASSAPSVANVDSATVTIPAGAYYVNTPTWGPNPNDSTPGTAQLSATDTRAALYAYAQGTADVAVITPNLNFSWGSQTLGIGQYNNQYVYTPDNASSPIAVTLSHAGTARTSTTVNGAAVSTVTIPAATNYVYFHVVGTVSGWDTLGASATSPPFNPATAYTAVSQGHVDPIGGWPASLSLTTNDSVLVTLYARDSTQTTHYVQDSTTFTLTSDANIQFVSGGASSAVITSVVIPKDAYYVQFYVKGVSQGLGSATISATNYVTYNTPTITVSP